MKNLFLKIILCLSSVALSSCLEVDMGYPEQVYFPKEGGELTVTGDDRFTFIQMSAGSTSGTEERDGETFKYHTYDWLKVEYLVPQRSELTIYAEPNTTGKTRKTTFRLFFTNEYSHITVKQGK